MEGLQGVGVGVQQGAGDLAQAPPHHPQAPPLGAGGGALLPGAVEQPQAQFVSRFLEGQSGVTIKHVACGDLFTACLTGEKTPRSNLLLVKGTANLWCSLLLS